jgi:hypothetical protein
MVAEKRARSKPLIRIYTGTGIAGGTAATANGTSRDSGQKAGKNDPASTLMWKYSPKENSTPRLEASYPLGFVAIYLNDLKELHSAGILTDDEFSAARQRLLGL